MKKNSVFSFLLLTGLLLTTCNNQKDNIPYVYVNFRISLNDPQFITLQAVGNFVYVNRGINGIYDCGYKGIILYRKEWDKFEAFERACPYDPKCGILTVDKIAINATDTVCCKSQFSLLLDGQVVKQPAGMPMKKYNAMFNPNTNELIVTN